MIWPQRGTAAVHDIVIFTARCYASSVLAMGPCLCLSVCLSVTSRSSTKTAKRRITQTTPHDSPGTLVFWYQRSPRNSIGVTPYEGAECRSGGSKSATLNKYPAISASCTGLVHLPSSSLCVQCPRAQSLAHYCSFCTWLIS